jgi:hypothetical protein
MAISITVQEKPKEGKKTGNKTRKYFEDFLHTDPKVLARYFSVFQIKGISEKFSIDPAVMSFIENIDDVAYSGIENLQKYPFKDPAILSEQIKLLKNVENSKLDEVFKEVFWEKSSDKTVITDYLKRVLFFLKKAQDTINNTTEIIQTLKHDTLLTKSDDLLISLSAASGEANNLNNYLRKAEQDELKNALQLLDEVEQYLSYAKKSGLIVKLCWA